MDWKTLQERLNGNPRRNIKVIDSKRSIALSEGAFSLVPKISKETQKDKLAEDCRRLLTENPVALAAAGEALAGGEVAAGAGAATASGEVAAGEAVGAKKAAVSTAGKNASNAIKKVADFAMGQSNLEPARLSSESD